MDCTRRALLVAIALPVATHALCPPPAHAFFPPPTHARRSPMPRMAADEKSLRQLVADRRSAKQLGLGLGAGLVTVTCAVGVGSGVFDPGVVAPVVAGGGLVAGLATANNYLANDERGEPMDEAECFEVRPSAGKGEGLFARRAIEQGAFLFDYLGERLDEARFFDRYPEGDGRYIAGITDELYIDGVDPSRSNAARWMNHAGPSDVPNVVWRKQRLGPRLAMHFYACAPIEAGAELLFDYGDEYWIAAGETPV